MVLGDCSIKTLANCYWMKAKPVNSCCSTSLDMIGHIVVIVLCFSRMKEDFRYRYVFASQMLKQRVVITLTFCDNCQIRSQFRQARRRTLSFVRNNFSRTSWSSLNRISPEGVIKIYRPIHPLPNWLERSSYMSHVIWSPLIEVDESCWGRWCHLIRAVLNHTLCTMQFNRVVN